MQYPITEIQVSRTLRLPGFLDIQNMKEVRLSALLTGRLYPEEIFMLLISVRSYRAIVGRKD